MPEQITPEIGDSDRRLTIWYLLTSLSVGGAEQTVIDLANNLDSDSYEVVLWTVFDENPLADRLDASVTHRSLGIPATTSADGTAIDGAASSTGYIRAPIQLARAIREERPDILHSFLYYDNLLARFVGVFSPETTVVTGERGFHNASRPVLRLVDRLTAPLSDLAISNSKQGGAYLVETGLDQDAVNVVPNGRRLDVYRDASSAGLSSTFGIPDGASVVGTVGRLVRRKGHHDLLEAWSGIVNQFPEAHLLLVGPGPERERLAELAREKGIAESVHLVGRREDVPECLALMDVFAFPSHWEGHPGALLEAMAAGLPIVATRVPGNVELLTDGETGLLVPPEDPVALGESIASLLADRDLARRLGTAARETAYERFTLPAMVDRYATIYAEA